MNSNCKRKSKTVTVDRWHDKIENPKDTTRKLLELINEFSEAAKCKINVYKSIGLLYGNNKISERN